MRIAAGAYGIGQQHAVKLNRMLLPDTVGTGGDSHTRFPIGISFPAGSGLVAFAAATGVMPLDMPESVLVRFKGEMQPGITLRDLVNAIPYAAIQSGDLTVEKKGKKNIFSGLKRCSSFPSFLRLDPRFVSQRKEWHSPDLSG